MPRHADILFPAADAGAIIAVDEYKGGDSGDRDSPRLTVGRLLFKHNLEAVEQLFESLTAADAANWHASGEDMPGLFTASEEDRQAIWAALRRVDSHVFGTNPTLAMISAPHLEQQWRRLRKTHPTALIPRKGTGAQSLFRFLSHTHGVAHGLFPVLRESKIVFVVDRQDWFRPSSTTRPTGASGFVRETIPIDRSVAGAPPEVWLRTKPVADCDPTLCAFINLVDSELWSFGRLLSVPGPEGTVHDAMNVNYRHGRSPDEPLADFDWSAVDTHVPEAARQHFEEFFIRAHSDGKMHILGG